MNEAVLIERFLAGRGITPEERTSFLHPDFKRDIHSPETLPDIEVAVERIVLAIKQGERIAVFGDYDADGVPATALLLRALLRAGANVEGIVPLRQEGYGLSMHAVERIVGDGTQLLIAVDNGTVAKAEIAALQEQGIQTIICDHHEPQEGHMAEALAVINPKRPDGHYPCRDLCACALAWKLAWALYERLGLPTDPLKWELDLVALSTVADMVPLRGENRALVRFGLKALRRSRNVGLKALAEAAGTQLAAATAQDIGFRLAPRLNATSRMHQETVDGQNASLRLLLTDDKAEAKRLADHLQRCNTARQALVEKHMQEANIQVAHGSDQLCFVLYGEHWSSGVIGLLAGRMLELHKRPVLALAMEDGKVKGSVRSVDGISVLDLLDSASDAFERFGGHAKAGGLTMDAADVSGLQERLQTWLQEQGATLELFAEAAKRPADLEVPLAEATLALADALRELEPFGTGFEEPLLASRVQIRAPRTVGREARHFSCLLVDGSASCKAIGFGMEDPAALPDAWYRAEYALQAEEWQGKRAPSCMLKRLTLL